MGEGEVGICSRCRLELPMTIYLDSPDDNELRELFHGRIEVERVISFFYYDKFSAYADIIKDAKFRGSRAAMRSLSSWLAAQIKDRHIFDEVDLIVPVPLHPKRELDRGYNQAEVIALAIGQTLEVDVDSSVVIRKRDTSPQSHSQSSSERRSNMRDAFKVSDSGRLVGRHILLVDDVITTGSTILSLAWAITQEVSDCKISICSLSSGRRRVYR